MFKVASVIQRNHVNFYQVLCEYDLNNSGYVSPDDLKIAFAKLQMNLSSTDLDNMLKYFDVAHMDRISIKEFSKNFFSTGQV